MGKRGARRWFVSGTVQGVGFRFFVQQKANSLGLSGWARNTSDGRVEVYASGAPERLNDLAAALYLGPRMSQVRGVEEQETAPEDSYGFKIR